MSSSARLSPGGGVYGDNPFATPSRNSIQSETQVAGPLGSQGGKDIEMHEASGAPSAARSTGAPFLQRWRQADQRAYLATVGRIGPSKKRNSEKAAAAGVGAGAAERKRAPAWACTIILGTLLALIIIAIVVPIAVVFSNHGSSSAGSGGSDNPSSPGPGTAPIPNSNVVSLKQGQYRGTTLPNGINQFLGMQYAAPPVKDLRFAAPQAPSSFDGVKAATKYGPGCHGLGAFSSDHNEDCLYLDVFAPTNTTNLSKLPVFVFIPGGGLQTSDSHFNGSSLIAASGFQMITVAMTYRVNAFGFLASSEIQKGASLNNGLKDQRMALQWVQDNIAQFGGDPSRVILAGESAGAGSAVMHTTAYGGRDDHLFQAAALQSQSLQAVRTVATSQFQYDYIVGNTSCSGQQDTLSCLRGLSIQGLVKAITNSPFPNGAGGNPVFPFNPVVDDDFVRSHPIAAYQNGQYVKVPMIFGDDTDEGTIFVPKDTSTTTAGHNFLRNTYPLINSTVLKRYDDLYNLTYEDGSDYWQKVAMAYGETRYTCPGIQLSNYVLRDRVPVWNFRYDVIDPIAQTQGVGVKHGSELYAIWGASSGAPVSYRVGGDNSAVPALVQAYWSSFIKHLDPNVDKLANAPTWDQWTGANRIHFVANGTAMENVDDDQATRCKYLNSIAGSIGQ